MAPAAIIVNPVVLASIMGTANVGTARGFVKPADSNQSGQLWDNATGPVYLALDATVSEAPSFSANPTQSVVEDGSTISDNVALKPVKVQIHGIVSDTPITLIRSPASFGADTPSKAAFKYLRQLLENRIPFDFIGGLTVYKNMVLTEFMPERTAQTGDSLQFKATLEQLIIVASEVVPATHYKSKTAVPKQSAGTQTLHSVTEHEGSAISDTDIALPRGLGGVDG